jgi:hypothetical protein
VTVFGKAAVLTQASGRSGIARARASTDKERRAFNGLTSPRQHLRRAAPDLVAYYLRSAIRLRWRVMWPFPVPSLDLPEEHTVGPGSCPR